MMRELRFFEETVMANKKDRMFTIVLLCIYGLILVWIVLLKASSPAELKYLPCARSLNLVPFHYDTEVNSHLSETLLNVAVFVPLGLYLGMLGVRWWKTILVGFAASVLFEAAQYAFSIGAADVTDLLTNTAGTAAGVGLYLLLRRVFKHTDRLHRVLNILFCVGTGLFLAFAVFLIVVNS